nr:MAG TPA: tail assembly protein [Caudoviricetes sp.]
MEIWLNNISIPVLPSEYQVQSSQNNQSETIIGIGEVSLKGKRNLMTISFSSFFPLRRNSSYCRRGSILKPLQYVDAIERMKQTGTVKIVITGSPIRMDCTIESFEWGENDGTGDIFYSISFKEYRNVGASKSSVAQDGLGESAPPADGANKETARTVPKVSTQEYIVKKGDTLTSIAKRLTGSSNWKPIYTANRAVIGGNPNRIKVGQKLVIPGG